MNAQVHRDTVFTLLPGNVRKKKAKMSWIRFRLAKVCCAACGSSYSSSRWNQWTQELPWALLMVGLRPNSSSVTEFSSLCSSFYATSLNKIPITSFLFCILVWSMLCERSGTQMSRHWLPWLCNFISLVSSIRFANQIIWGAHVRFKFSATQELATL